MNESWRHYRRTSFRNLTATSVLDTVITVVRTVQYYAVNLPTLFDFHTRVSCLSCWWAPATAPMHSSSACILVQISRSLGQCDQSDPFWAFLSEMWMVLLFVSLPLALMLPMTTRCDAFQLLVQGLSNSASQKRYSTNCRTLSRRRNLLFFASTSYCGCVLASAGRMLITCPQSASADDSTSTSTSTMRPYAPLEALIPAIKKRLLLKQCLDLSKVKSSSR